MADVIHVEKGFSPWQPAQDARLVKQYQYYEIPLCGVIEQHGMRFFFACLAGADEAVNMWFYGRLSPEVETALDQATAEEFTSSAQFEGPAVMALAAEGPGIVATTMVDGLTSDEIRAAHEILYRELEAWASAAKELEPEPALA